MPDSHLLCSVYRQSLAISGCERGCAMWSCVTLCPTENLLLWKRKESAYLKNGVPVTLPNFKLFILDSLLISSICLTAFVHLHAFHYREMPLLLKSFVLFMCDGMSM